MTEPLELLEKNESNPDEIRDMAAFLYELIESQITRADTKAGLIIAATTVFAAGLILFSKAALPNIFDNSLAIGTRLTGLFVVLTYVALALSMVFALLVTRPILAHRETDNTFFFFGKIARMNYAEFAEKFSSQSVQDIRESLLVQVHTTAELANLKFKLIRYSLDFLIAAVVLWTLVQLMIALGN